MIYSCVFCDLMCFEQVQSAVVEHLSSIRHEYDDQCTMRKRPEEKDQENQASEKTQQRPVVESGPIVSAMALASNFQRKIDINSIPLQDMQAYLEDSVQLLQESLLNQRTRLELQAKNKRRFPLICIASLIDKVPNLGGIHKLHLFL